MNTNMNTTNQTEDDIKEISPEEMMEELNNTILSLDLKIEKYEKNIKTYSALSLEDEPDRDTKIEKIKADLSTANAELFKAKAQQRQLTTAMNNAVKNAEKDSNNLRLKDAVFDFIKENPSIAYIHDEKKYYHMIKEKKTTNKLTVVEYNEDPTSFCERLAKHYKIHINSINPKDVYMFFVEATKVFNTKRFSIDEDTWDEHNTYLPLKHMETYFIDRAEVAAIDPAVINCFEQLMYSLSGGKDENKNHIEQWIVHKVLNYRKAASTPDLVIVGPDGGNGKGIIQEIIKKMFVSKLCGMANAKTLNNNFNGILMGKLLVFFDDQDKTQIPLEVVKQLAGASNMIVEVKGQDQIEIEKTHSSAFFSNVLPFKLSSNGKEGGVDRRFSVIRTDITLIESVIKHAADRGETITSSEAIELMDDMINNILYNRNNIAQWFQYLKAKHSHIDDKFVLKALHGADYHAFLEEQYTVYDLIWDKLVEPTLDAGQALPMFVIKEVLRHQTEKNIDETTINAEIMKRINTSKKKYAAADARATVRIGVDENSPTKRCSYFYNVNAKGKLFFDWSRVSLRGYVKVDKHEELIKDSDYIFNSAPEEVPPILQASSSKYAWEVNNIKNRAISPEID